MLSAYYKLRAEGLSADEAVGKFQLWADILTMWFDVTTAALNNPYVLSNYTFRLKPKHWDLMQEYEHHAKSNPDEYKNWWFSTDGGIEWDPCDVAPEFNDRHEYRREPKPQPDANGWFKAECAPCGTPVDIYSITFGDVTDVTLDVVLSEAFAPDRFGYRLCKLTNGNVEFFTHWRPATKLPVDFYEGN